MRFMMMVRANKDSEAGVPPTDELISAMMNYNEEMAKAGILIDLAGLQPSSKGAWVTFSGGHTTVVDGPFAEAKELIAGYWLINVGSKAEAIEWAKRCPSPFGKAGGELELRQLFELDDFGPSEAVEQAHRIEKELANSK
jgi:hypothetical protein